MSATAAMRSLQQVRAVDARRSHSGFAVAISFASVRIATFVFGRPGPARAERRHHRRRSHSRCHRTTVSGWTNTSASRQCRHV